MCPKNEPISTELMKKKRIFVAAWSYPPKMSGESVVCKRTLENSAFCYDVCSCMQKKEDVCCEKVRAYPVSGKYIMWPFRVVRQFLQLDKKEHYDIIMTRVMPPNGHLAGLVIKLLRPHIKWVVYFSDPIWNSPFISFVSLFQKNVQQKPNYLLMKVFGTMAWLGIQLGDLVVFNNERLAKYVLGKQYLRFQDKVVIAPYGHEGVHISSPNMKQASDKVTVAHIGQIYGARSFVKVVKALELLRDQHPAHYERLEILQVGFICDFEKNCIANSSVASTFRFEGEVNYEQSLEYMRSADYTIILDPYFAEKRKNIYVPVKIYDYMSVGAPIIVIADADSATADIAKSLGCPIVGHKSEDILGLFLRCIVGDISTAVDVGNQFHCQRGVNELDKRLSTL